MIQKANKGNYVVILNKKNYIYITSKFWKPAIDTNKVLNHVLDMENRVIDVPKKIRNNKEISDHNYNDLDAVGSRTFFFIWCSLNS